jgi:hypothetical protein
MVRQETAATDRRRGKRTNYNYVKYITNGIFSIAGTGFAGACGFP